MVQVQDKIPFFRRIIENEFEFQLDWMTRAHEAEYSEKKAELELQSNEELTAQSMRQHRLIDMERRKRLGQAEADAKQALLKQRQQFMNQLRQDVTIFLKQWLESDEFLERISSITFHKVLGPESLEVRFKQRFPETDYQIKTIDGLILFNNADESRIDLTLPRWLERYDKALNQMFQEMVGA
jgi:phosphoglycerate-specific signal transduction histidine kinase